MNMSNVLAIILFLVLNIVCISPANAQENITNIRIEYIGETGKSPPIIILGTEKPKQKLIWEDFYQVTELILASIRNSCVRIGCGETITKNSILKVTFSGRKKTAFVISVTMLTQVVF